MFFRASLDVVCRQERGVVDFLEGKTGTVLDFLDRFAGLALEQAVALVAFRDVGRAHVADVLAFAGKLCCLRSRSR